VFPLSWQGFQQERGKKIEKRGFTPLKHPLKNPPYSPFFKGGNSTREKILDSFSLYQREIREGF